MTAPPDSYSDFQSQLIKLITGSLGGIDPSLGENSVSSSGLQKLGLHNHTIMRAKEATFLVRETREHVKQDDLSIRNRLDAYMESHSEQGWRSTEMINVRDRLLPEPPRILHTPFRQCFEDFLNLNPDIDIGVTTLFKMKNKWLPHYRQSRRTDRQIALCPGCTPFQGPFEAIKKTKVGQIAFPHTTEEFLLEFTVCSQEALQARYQEERTSDQLAEDREKCFWSECRNCNKPNSIDKLQNYINSFLQMEDFDENEDFTFPVLNGNDFVNQVGTVKDDAAEVLITSTYRGPTCGTGEKLINHRGRIHECSNYMNAIYESVAVGENAIILNFDHGKRH